MYFAIRCSKCDRYQPASAPFLRGFSLASCTQLLPSRSLLHLLITYHFSGWCKAVTKGAASRLWSLERSAASLSATTHSPLQIVLSTVIYIVTKVNIIHLAMFPLSFIFFQAECNSSRVSHFL